MTVGYVLGVLGVLFLLAYLTETLVEAIFGKLFDHIPKLAPFHWLQEYLALGVGVIGAFVYDFDLIYLLGEFLRNILAEGLDLGVLQPLVEHNDFGVLLTGLSIGMGAQYLHDAVVRYFRKPDITG